MTLAKALRVRLEERKQTFLMRQRLTIMGPQQPILRTREQEFLGFTSNDYLGLANHPKLTEAFVAAARKYGVGSGASHLVCGHSEAHEALEHALAKLTGRSRAVLFSSGYMANMGAISALVGAGDGVFQDRLNHASLLDGGKVSGARFQRYQHCDSEDLERRLQQTNCRYKLVVSDTVFSMDGDQAPIANLVDTCQKHNAYLMLDDAHGLGVIGSNVGERGGHGILDAEFDEQQIPVYMGTLGKALGCYGAFIAGSDELAEAMVQFARPYIYTTALPPAVAAAGLAAVKLLAEEGWRKVHLRELIQNFRQQAKALDLPILASNTAIQPLLIGDSQQAMAASDALRQKGILVTAIRPPTVPVNSARLRITLSAAHSHEQLNRLMEALTTLLHLGLLNNANLPDVGGSP